MFVFAFLAVLPAEVAAPRAPLPFDVIPASAQGDVPLNPLILFADPFVEVQLVDDGAVIAPTSAATVRSDDFASLQRLVVRENLRPNTSYRLVTLFDGAAGEEISRFTTGDEADDEAPGDFTASVSGSVLTVSADEAIAVVDVRRNQGSSGFLAVGEDGTAEIAVSETNQTLSLTAIDFAGNASAPIDVEVAGIDPRFAGFGCASTENDAPAAALVLGLLALLGRKRLILRPVDDRP